MIPEIGSWLLALALGLSFVLCLAPWWHDEVGFTLRLLTKPITYLLSGVLLLAFFLLCYSLLQCDFSVEYVVLHANQTLPWYYRISAAWGAHEGSMLLWVVILSLWMVAFARKSSHVPLHIVAKVLGVLGFISLGFIGFLLMTSNPFARILPDVPLSGGELNPLLQDFGLIVHPPLLYMGYVGFAVPFAFAVVALLHRKIEFSWAGWTKRWALMAFSFLTVGILLGSWWAYYELGWGGWWFWDPVENASFMPWLAGAALIHSLSATEKRRIFHGWSLLLALTSFALSLLGTFLVRSGVLTSVHAFANDPERGLYILVFLGIVVGGSLGLFAWRYPSKTKSGLVTNAVSRESFLLLNNILLTSMLVVVLTGTLYPLFMDALGLGKISIGAPYFNVFFVPLGVALSLLAALGLMTRWQDKNSKNTIKKMLRYVGVAALVALGIGAAVQYFNAYLLVAITALILVVMVFIAKLRSKQPKVKRHISFWAMHLAHFGLAVVVLAVALTSLFSEEKDAFLKPGEKAYLGGFEFLYEGALFEKEANYESYTVNIRVSEGERLIAELKPQKRYYPVSRQTMTEAGIRAGLLYDVYVSMGERSGEGWSFRLHQKVAIRWVWLGALMMAFGALLALFAKNKARTRRVHR